MVTRQVAIRTVILLFQFIICGSFRKVTTTRRYLNQPAGGYQQSGDLRASSSNIFSPSIDLDYGEYGQQQGKGGSFEQQNAGHSAGEIGFFGTAARRGSAGHASEDAYLGDHQSAHADRQNAGYYGDAEGVRRGYDSGGAVAAAQGFNNRGLTSAAVASKGGHRKGHHSSGFHNSYHKDESGNSSTFYDDALDNGDHYFYDDKGAAYDDRGAKEYKGAFQDGQYKANSRGNQGQYGAVNGYDDARGRKGSYSRDEFYDDAHKYGQKEGRQGHFQNLHGDQRQNGGAYYGNAREDYAGVVRNPSSAHKPYLPTPEVYNYGTQGGDYYPVNSYSPKWGGYYGKAVSAPVYSDDLKFGNDFAVDGDSDNVDEGYFHANPNEYKNYYGTYRGVVY